RISQTGVWSTGSRRSARRKRSLRSGLDKAGSSVDTNGPWYPVRESAERGRMGSARPLAALAEHHLEAFPQLQVAGLRQGRERGVAVQELLAPDLAAAADVAAL